MAVQHRQGNATHVVGINDKLDHIAGVGGQRADGWLGNEILQLLKETQMLELRQARMIGYCVPVDGKNSGLTL